MKNIIKVILLCLVMALAKASTTNSVFEASEIIVEALSSLESTPSFGQSTGGCVDYNSKYGCRTCISGYSLFCFYKDRDWKYCSCEQKK